ncbi:MAG TPA: AsmA-like C-terminal region-containing protein [Blastocatellia bacterium]|nr:AsmA-like C-terminal region-containing protein [Blastocatellia bacterium]
MERRSGRGCFARLLILVILAAVGMVLAAPYLPLNRFKPQIEATLSTQLGRKVTVGSVNLSLARGPEVVIQDLKASEDPAFASGNTIEAGTVRVRLAVGPLLENRQLVPTNLQLDSPRVTFNRNSQGAWSWSTLGGTPSEAGLSGGRSLDGLTRGLAGSSPLVQTDPGAACLLLYALIGTANVGTLRGIELRQASVTFVEEPEKLKQVTFDHLDLSAALSRVDKPEPSTHASGRLRAQSEKTESTELLTADLPFDLNVGIADVGGFTITGGLGPGDLQTGAFAAQNFQSSITVNGNIARFDEIQASFSEGQLRGGVQLDLAAPRPRFGVEGNVDHVNIDQSIGALFGIPGAITGHVNGDFKLVGLLAELPRSFPTVGGDGQLSSDDLFMSRINLSEQVAKRLSVSSIGNMAPGTNVGHIDGQFRISDGAVTIQNLHVKQLDGLGDAATDRGVISVSFSGGRPNIQLDFPTTVTLSQEAEAAARQASPLLGIAASLLGRSNQLSVPIHITGDMQNPQVLVDLPRLLQSFGK